jgi:hypothetical protein
VKAAPEEGAHAPGFSQGVANRSRRVAKWAKFLAKTILVYHGTWRANSLRMSTRLSLHSSVCALAATSFALLMMGCSSSSSTTPSEVDAGHDAAEKKHDAGKPKTTPDAGSDARTVCEPAPIVDAGVDAPVDSGLPDALADVAVDAAPPVDAPIACTSDLVCPAGLVCHTKTTGEGAGTCVANDGTTFCTGEPAGVDGGGGGGIPGKCSINADDMCCTVGAGCVAKPEAGVVGGGACCPGAAGDLYCQSQLSNDQASCGAAGLCATCMDTCLNANPAAYQKFLGYQVTECGCAADGSCYDACHTSTTTAATSTCGQCLAAQSKEGLTSTCTLAAAVDCSNDPHCTAYQACAGMCPM